MIQTMTRAEAADACLAAMDSAFLKALCEPARLEIVRQLVKLGSADISQIAQGLPQDRSVVSRHLQLLERAGVAISSRSGRRVVYELDGPAIMGKLGGLTQAFAPLVPLCCPGTRLSTPKD
jgi:DNA-binding transcriptional ArsR family regulator